jgi:hypothetical protein
MADGFRRLNKRQYTAFLVVASIYRQWNFHIPICSRCLHRAKVLAIWVALLLTIPIVALGLLSFARTPEVLSAPLGLLAVGCWIAGGATYLSRRALLARIGVAHVNESEITFQASSQTAAKMLADANAVTVCKRLFIFKTS